MSEIREARRADFAEKNGRRKQGRDEVRQGQRDARSLRRQYRGTFGSAAPHIFNALVVGTMGESRIDRGKPA